MERASTLGAHSSQSCASVRNWISVNDLTVKSTISAGPIKERIAQALLRAAHLGASRISVDVNGSEVTLRGRVRTWLERTQAQDAAWRAPGMHYVQNDINIVN